MDYTKLDAALSAAVIEQTPCRTLTYSISVRTNNPLNPHEALELEQLGFNGVQTGRNIFTADVSPQTIVELTDKPWIKRLSLARQLHPLQDQ